MVHSKGRQTNDYKDLIAKQRNQIAGAIVSQIRNNNDTDSSDEEVKPKKGKKSNEKTFSE